MLFSIEELEAAHTRYARTQTAKMRERAAGFVYELRPAVLWDSRAAQKTRAEVWESDRRVLLQVTREFPDCTVAELSEASGRSKSWVRKHLRASGIVLATVRQKKAGRP